MTILLVTLVIISLLGLSRAIYQDISSSNQLILWDGNGKKVNISNIHTEKDLEDVAPIIIGMKRALNRIE